MRPRGGRGPLPSSLRARIVLVCSCVLVLCCVALTLGNNLSAARLADAIEASPVSASQCSASSVQTGGTAGVAGTGSQAAETVRAAMSLEARSDYRGQSALAMVVIAATGIGAVYWLVGRSMSSLREVGEHIGRMSASDLGERIPVPKGPSEAVDLAASFNAMSSRLNEAFALQGRFAQNAAHELRTPLAAVKANVQLYRKRLSMSPGPEGCNPGPLDLLELLGTVEAQVDRLSAVVGDLLAFSDAQGAFPRERVEVCRLIREELARMFPCREASGAGRVLLSEFEGFVVGNRPLLGRVFANLVDNVLRYGRRDGIVRITADLGPTDLLVHVDDEGEGVPPSDRERVFEAFYRADASRSRESGGAGLGLALSRSVIRSHGGDVSVGDCPRGGCRFTVRLPRDVASTGDGRR